MKVRGKLVVRYMYTVLVSKNRAGRLKQIKQEKKVVHQYEGEDLARYHVLLLDKFLSKLPIEVQQTDIVYLKPKAVVPMDATAPLFTSVPIGSNVLGQMMKTMRAEGKLEKAVANHFVFLRRVKDVYCKHA